MAKHLAKDVAELAFKAASGVYGKSTYRLGGNGDNAGYAYNIGTYYNGAWRSDCLGFVHIMANPDKLFNGDKSKQGGGATLNNFVNNSTEAVTLNNYCSSKGSFPKNDLKPAALLQSSGHVGLFIGERAVGGKIYNTAECAWFSSSDNGWKLTYTDLSTGNKYTCKGGYYRGQWQKWGYFNHIDYSNAETGSNAVNTSLLNEWMTAAKKDGIYTGIVDGVWGSYCENALKKVSIKKGSTSLMNLNKFYQERLKALGYYTGWIDGDIGSMTDSAIRNYQKDHPKCNGVDGVIGYYTTKCMLGLI